MGYFPKVAKLVQLEWESLQQRRGRRISVREMADLLRASPASVVAWRAGSRAPEEGSARRLAELFFTTKARQERFVGQILAASTDTVRGGGVDPLEPLIAGLKEQVNIGMLPSGHLGEPGSAMDPTPHGFFADVFINGLVKACFKPGPVQRIALKDVIPMLSSGQADVCLPLLASLDRIWALHIYVTSIRIGLNFVVPKEFREGAARDGLADALAIEPNPDNPYRDQILLLVEDDELGGHYVRGRGFPERQILAVDRLEVEDTAKKVVSLLHSRRNASVSPTRAHQSTRVKRGDGGPLIPVVAFDELSCARLLGTSALREEGCGLLYPPWEPSPAPSWNLGFAVSRKNAAWFRHLQTAFDLYVDSFAHDVALRYVRLAESLLAQLSAVVDSLDESGTKQSRDAKTRLWVERMLNLPASRRATSRGGTYSRVWDRVLELAAQRWRTQPLGDHG